MFYPKFISYIINHLGYYLTVYILILEEVIVLKLEGEETFFGESIETPEEFIKDLCERVNTANITAMDEVDKMNQLAYLLGFLTALKGRLNRVCEKI